MYEGVSTETDSDSLLRGNSQKRSQRLSYCFGALALIFLVLTIVFGVLYRQEMNKNDSDSSTSPPPPAPVAVDANYDFPLYQPDPWNVEQPYTRRISFTTDEGTWMNVDISPSGTELAFDLLGDLYTLDLTAPGASAVLLRGGIAFDVQPRYSPDGTQILYTSDSSGCENLWVLDRANPTNTRPITNETYRVVTDGYWSPDGTKIVATKWFTSTRSIPAGEIWTFNVAGAPTVGQQFVGRAALGSQVGPQEALYSPDGKYIYYCQNIMDGTAWNYNKNPHQTIFAIYRKNIQTNEVEFVAGPQGGAGRPVLSHNGQKLAFINRNIFQTSLMVTDLLTGNQLTIFDGLSLDGQASSCPYGTYPRFSFTPDDREVILWAQGGLWRIDLATGLNTSIPFTALIDLAVGDTVRSPIPIPTTSFPVSVVEWVSVGNIGGANTAIYTALGVVYAKNLADSSAPYPLRGNPNPAFYEFYPAFNSAAGGGDNYAFVQWQDDLLGSVKVMRPQGLMDVTTTPGRYVETKWCPSTVLSYRRLGGDGLTGYTFELNPGTYVAVLNETNPQAPKLLTTNGANPHWSTDCSSIYLERMPNLVRLDLDSNFNVLKTTTVATTKYGVNIRASPDGKYAAWLEFQQVYVTVLAATPTTLDGRPGYQSSPLWRVSTDGAHWFDWDGRPGSEYVLRFAMGATLFEIDMNQVFQACHHVSNMTGCIDSFRVSYNLSWNAPADIGQTNVCFYNAQLVTMENGEDSVRNDSYIHVINDRIQDVGFGACPASATTTIDAMNGTILPGLIDVHAHWSLQDTIFPQQQWQFIVNLAFGVTTMHNPSADTAAVFVDSELVISGRRTGPRIYSTGTILYGAGSGFHCEIGSLDDALSNLRRLKAYGGWSAKSYNQPCRAARQRILQAARQLNMLVVPEGGMNLHSNLNQIIDGHTTIEHSIPVTPLYYDVINLFAESGTGYTPTLIVSYGDLMGENYFYQNEKPWENQRLMTFSMHSVVESRTVRATIRADDRDYLHMKTAASALEIFRQGGLVQTGAHGQMQGIGLHWEMQMLTQGGWTNHEVLFAATAMGARSLGLDGIVGRLTPGLLADLIVYDPGNSPLDQITNARSPKYVMKAGRLFDASTMAQVLPTAQPLPKGPVINTPHL